MDREIMPAPPTHYRAKCPRCSHPNVLPIPAKQKRTTIDFTCSYSPLGKTLCGARYRTYVAETETFTLEESKVKSYMNRAERQAFLVALNIADNFANILLDMPNLPEETKYAYREAQEWLAHGAYVWMKDKDQPTVQQLSRESKMYAICLTPRRDAKEIAKKNAAADAAMRNEIYQNDRDVVLDLALATFQFCCRTCDGTPAQSEEGCPVKYALDKLAVPSWDAVPECHYAYSGLTDEEIAATRSTGTT
jgi:hypothetical protein